MGKAIKEEDLSPVRVQPDLAKLIPMTRYRETNPREAAAVEDMHAEASTFLQRQKWCESIRQSYVGLAHPGIVAVFLFDLVPTSADVDQWVWVVVGDLPSAYIGSDDCPTAGAALDGYIGEMDEWVEAALAGGAVDALIPVNVAPTRQNAIDLKKRLDFLHERILNLHKEDL